MLGVSNRWYPAALRQNFAASHDLEDVIAVIAVVDGRAALCAEVAAASLRTAPARRACLS